METQELLETLETLAGAVGYLCALERRELELPQAQRHHLVGPLINDRDAIASYEEAAFRIRDRLQELLRAVVE